MGITISQLTHSTKPQDVFEPPFAMLHYFVSEHIAVLTDESKEFAKSSKWAYLSQKCRHEVAANGHFQTLKGHIPPMWVRLHKKRNLAMAQRTTQLYCYCEQRENFKQLLGRMFLQGAKLRQGADTPCRGNLQILLAKGGDAK